MSHERAFFLVLKVVKGFSLSLLHFARFSGTLYLEQVRGSRSQMGQENIWYARWICLKERRGG